MIFISGIHGVGKTFFVKKVKEICQIETYTASTLISNYKKCVFDLNKKVEDINDNQQILLSELKKISNTGNSFLLDGHFCLINKNEIISRIGISTYVDLEPKAIVLLTEQPEIIVKRRKMRDGIIIKSKFVDKFQEAEKAYAKEVAKRLKIPIFISLGSDDLDKAVNFIMKNM